MAITARIDPLFHEDSYGYRHNKFPHDAVAKAKERCMKYAWVLDMGFPQGSAIGLLLANLFLRYVFDMWMQNIPTFVKKVITTIKQKS